MLMSQATRQKQEDFTMRKGESVVLLIIGLLTLSMVSINIVLIRRARITQAAQLPPARLLEVSLPSVIGRNADYIGDSSNPYTLVEFADYQCPPCRAINARVAEIVARYPQKLCYCFRNLPLERIHPFARPAAIAAEAARAQGQFWPVHKALFTEPSRLSVAGIAAIPVDFHLDRARFYHDCATTAKAQLAADMEQADMLDLQGTPSFLLCCPDGHVWLLSSIDQLSAYIR